jgi:putative oxidoreductase
VPAEQVMNTQIHFWKNIAIAGGFLSLAAFGAGAFSVDAKRGGRAQVGGYNREARQGA